MPSTRLRLRLPVALAALVLQCGPAPYANVPANQDPAFDPAQPFHTLAEYRLFQGDGTAQLPRTGVLPYDVVAPLFSDFTTKLRFFVLPPGGHITYRDDGVWDFPVGTILVKTFAYPRDMRDASQGLRLLETRLLLRTAAAFIPHTYVWNEAQTEAVRTLAGARIPVSWVDADGATQSLTYLVPNTNQCLTCHGQMGDTHTLGLRTMQFDRAGSMAGMNGNQLDMIASMGLFDRAPAASGQRQHLADPRDASAPIDARARAYLHANCAHCHNAADHSLAQSTGLNLNVEEQTPVNLGVCRHPFSAGRGSGSFSNDVVPGHPEQSIMVFRMNTNDAEIKMPQIPTQLIDPFGVDLITQWIAAMPAQTCM